MALEDFPGRSLKPTPPAPLPGLCILRKFLLEVQKSPWEQPEVRDEMNGTCVIGRRWFPPLHGQGLYHWKGELMLRWIQQYLGTGTLGGGEQVLKWRVLGVGEGTFPTGQWGGPTESGLNPLAGFLVSQAAPISPLPFEEWNTAGPRASLVCICSLPFQSTSSWLLCWMLSIRIFAFLPVVFS